MIDISVGAVGAAIVAGIVSLIGLIIGKEQKVSEFRQAWIDELRKCLISYLVNINAVCDFLRLRKAGKELDDSALIASYKLLNDASHGIVLRINSKEKPAKALLKAMAEFEELAKSNANIVPENIRPKEKAFKDAAKKLLKFEWKRVKRGETIFVWTKNAIFVALAFLAIVFMYLVVANGASGGVKQPPSGQSNLYKLL